MVEPTQDQWDILAIFREEARRLRRLSAYGALGRVSLEFKQLPDGTWATSVPGVPEEALIAYVATVRKFVAKRSDIHVRKVISLLLNSAADATTRGDLARRLAQFDRLPAHEPWVITVPGDARPLDRWEIFDLWTNSHVVHDELIKVRRWQSLSKHDQDVARWLAYSYMDELTRVVGAVTQMVSSILEQPNESP